MGLNLMVGYLAAAKEEDADFSSAFAAQLSVLNKCLLNAGVGTFAEPPDLPEEERFSCQMFGYSGLHHLRRFAAYSVLQQPIYEPSRELPDEDKVIAQYYDTYKSGGSSRLRFQHLILHSDAEGFYVPVDFEEVIRPAEDLDVIGGEIGSAQQLLAECRALADLLEMPYDLDPESEEVWNAADSPGIGPLKWQRYGIESFSCIRLIQACERSLATGSALVFC